MHIITKFHFTPLLVILLVNIARVVCHAPDNIASAYLRLQNTDYPSFVEGDANPEEVLIAVMGATGSGKTTFVNTASNGSLEVGRGLHSCTKKVQVSKPFEIDGRWVTLIDTPGFDDTKLSDTEVLTNIAAFLSETYRQGVKLAGVIYVHRITDPRMGGLSISNFRMFRELCGEKTLKNVVLMTNMWGNVSSEVGEAREAELASEDRFFKPALDKGAQLLRHNNTVEGARAVIGRIVRNHPLPLRIQEELVDEGKEIVDTGAAVALDHKLNEQAKKYREEMRRLRGEMKRAMENKDEETRKEIEEQTRRLLSEMARLKEDGERLASTYKAEKEALTKRIDDLSRYQANQQSEVGPLDLFLPLLFFLL